MSTKKPPQSRFNKDSNPEKEAFKPRNTSRPEQKSKRSKGEVEKSTLIRKQSRSENTSPIKKAELLKNGGKTISSGAKKSKAKPKAKPRNLLLFWTVVLIFLLFIGSGILLFLVSKHNDAKVGVDKAWPLDNKYGFDCEYSEAQSLFPFGDGVIKITSTKIAYISIAGNELYSYDVNFEQPVAVFSKEKVLVYDHGGFFAWVFDKVGKVATIQAPGSISQGAISQQSTIALIYESPKIKGAVGLFDQGGKFLAQWNSSESGFPISLAFTPNTDILNISLLDTDGSVMQPFLKQITIESGETKAIKDLAVFNPSLHLPLPGLLFIKEQVIMYGAKEAITWMGETEKNTDSFGKIFGGQSGSKTISLLYQMQEDSMVWLTQLDQQLQQTVEPFKIGEIFYAWGKSEDSFVVAADEYLYLISQNNLALKGKLLVNAKVLRLGFLPNGHIIAVTETGVREIIFE